GVRIRCHGDYHLGHLLYTGNDVVVIDFEGDTGRSVAERRIKRSALRDVASLIRSFHYAAGAALFGLDTGRGRSPGVIRAEDRAALMPWARAWCYRVTREFVTSYPSRPGAAALLPPDPRLRQRFLELMVLEKALEEVAFELPHRPDWVQIPLRAVAGVLTGG